MTRQHSKSEPCYCGSGQLYKFCCINLEKRKDLIDIRVEEKSLEQQNIDAFLNNALAQIAQQSIGLKNFCKQNNCYLFSSFLTIAQCEELELLLKEKKLNLNQITDLYVEKIRELGEKKILEIIYDKSNTYKYYQPRLTIIDEAIKAHFFQLYSVSIPIFIIQIESVLRDLGQLDNKDKFKPTIKDDKISGEPLYLIKDDIKYYNSFIHQLFAGNTDQKKFNRNTILHGFNINYADETNSTLMLLALLEISNFLWWEDNIGNFKSFTQ